MAFKDLPNNLKPREKVISSSVGDLTDIELLAIFLGNGTKKDDVLDLSKQLISKFGNFRDMANLSIEDFQKIQGIGIVKSIKLVSLFEFSNRLNNSHLNFIYSDHIANNIFNSRIKNATKENFVVILLDSNNKVIYTETLYKGTYRELSIEPKEVISLALKKDAKKFYCFHNHPSGDLRPSAADKLITSRLEHYSRLFGIKMIGHFISIGRNSFAKI